MVTTMTTIERVQGTASAKTPEDFVDAEDAWIAMRRRNGPPLTNTIDGIRRAQDHSGSSATAAVGC